MWPTLFCRRSAPKRATLAPDTPPVTPSGTLPILSSHDLLITRRAQVNRIEELAATTAAHFERYYLPVLHRMARWVQQLPASESHHHAYAGGLLDHVLEVAIRAMQIRLGYLLPMGGLPEDIARDRDRWTFSVFAVALIHDAAKPAVDQQVTLFDGEGTNLGLWHPWLGDLTETPGAMAYSTAFVRHRDYTLHEKAALLLAPRLFPAEALSWLAEDQACFGAWLGVATGDSLSVGVLGEILGRADGYSVGQNLGAENGPRGASHAVIPLWEKLVTALRHLIETQELPLNRNGAAGWRVDEDLWLVSKRTVDALRLHLTQSGHPGIPTQNERIFDILQEHGVLVPNGDRAIWRAEVRGNGFAHTLTLLRIPVRRLWLEPDRWPSAFDGEIGVPDSNAEASMSPTMAETPGSAQVIESMAGVEPGPIEYAPSTGIQRGSLTGDASAISCSEQKRFVGLHLPRSSSHDDPFLAWLRAGLSHNTIACNHPGARVHVVPEGVLLVSPGIFMDYVTANPNGADSWERIQRRFLKWGLHERTAEDLNMHSYPVTGSHRQTVIKGVLIKDPTIVFGDRIPSPNPHLIQGSPASKSHRAGQMLRKGTETLLSPG